MVEREDVELLVVAWFHRLSISKACGMGWAGTVGALARARLAGQRLGSCEKPRVVMGRYAGGDREALRMGTMSSAPDLFVVCKQCGSEVSPYITECPYCGHRLRRRAPDLPREKGRGLSASAAPRLRLPRFAHAPGTPARRRCSLPRARGRGPPRSEPAARLAALRHDRARGAQLRGLGAAYAGATWTSAS